MARGLNQIAGTLILSAALLVVSARGAAADDLSAMLQRDWQRQLDLRFQPAHEKGAAVTRERDAAGGCDGVIDGKYGFHTANELNPWWQVDLQSVQPVAKVIVYNRTDAGMAARTARLEIHFSADGKQWEKVYAHNGRTFYGYPDKKPLTVDAGGRSARFVRLQVLGKSFLHLDEVQVLGAKGDNLALRKPATQSSISQWSCSHTAQAPDVDVRTAALTSLQRGGLLADDLKNAGVDTAEYARAAAEIQAKLSQLPKGAPAETIKSLYFQARAAVRKLALANPLLNFDSLLVNKQVPGSFTHMSDQYLGWWSRPGGGVYVLDGIKSGQPKARCLTASFAQGSFLRPILSWDGKRVLFAYCRCYPEVAAIKDKVNKGNLPEDSFYHLYEMNVDGSGLRQLTHGKYNDMDGRYLPDGRIVFLSTRRGSSLQYGRAESLATMANPALPEGYVRCGGDHSRPCAIYTLHTMNGDGSEVTAISPFEMFEWTPAVANDGSILYARWDYIDRDNMLYMKLWRTNPDGTAPSHVFGNYLRTPHTGFEPRPIPGSKKIVFTAGAHHSITGGTLLLLDPAKGPEGDQCITHLTPELGFPESDVRGPGHELLPHFYCSPWPLSEKYYLVAWSDEPLIIYPGMNTEKGMGIYLLDAFGNLDLLYRDESINTLSPMPLRATPPPPVIQSQLPKNAPAQGRFLLTNVYQSLKPLPAGVKIERLRVVAVPPKTQPEMNTPNIGIMHDDPGKCVLGTVPVEADGSAYFEAPAGVTIFFQALDRDGIAVQTMRSATYLQPGQTLSCVGCHEARNQAPVRRQGTPLAARRAASKLAQGPAGSWPLSFERLVLPVVQAMCAACHGADTKRAIPTEVRAAWTRLIQAKKPSLRELVTRQYREPYSTPGACVAAASPLLGHFRSLLARGKIDKGDFERLVTWMDLYGQFAGQFSPEQANALELLRQRWTELGIVQAPQEKIAPLGNKAPRVASR